MKLACENLHKRYRSEILSGCSLSMDAGECVIVRGVSGGGKSTLLRILSRLEPADAGVVVHGGVRFAEPPAAAASPYPFLTLVFQQLFLWPHLSMSENLSLALSHAKSAPLAADALDLLERLSIASLLGLRPHECSVGQQQRLTVARAILSKARFLLLDEPSSALDRASRQTLVTILAEEKARGRGLLIVTHDERDFDSIADRRLLLDRGRLEPF